MSKKPWLKKKPAFKPAPAVVNGPRVAEPKLEPIAPAGPPTLPPPMPPLGSRNPEMAPGETRPPGRAAVLDDAKLKDGLAKTFLSVTQGVPRLANYALQNSAYQIEFRPVTPEEGDLWATFALPVLKMYLPNVEQHPVTVLATVTVGILIGKIEIKKKEAPNATDGSETDPAPAYRML